MRGTSVTLGGVNVTPESQSVLWVSRHGGFAWSAPSAVLVERDGREERIPVYDVTRLAQLGVLGALLGISFLRWMMAAEGERR